MSDHPTPPSGWPATVRRLREQRWLLDATIRQIGVDWDQGRSRYLLAPCGLDAEPDFARVREQVKKLADIAPAFEAVASRRERLMDEAVADGRDVAARDHAFIAAVLWGAAEWPFFVDAASARRAALADARKRRCYDAFIARAHRPVRRLVVEALGRRWPALLHLPPAHARGAVAGTEPTADGRVPAILHIGGMDSYKEHAVALHGDRYLERGIARLVVDGPGMGESIHDGGWVTATNWIEVGLAALELLRSQPEVDPDRVGLTGVSFGSFWATQIAARATGLVGTAVWAVCQEPGCRNLFESVSPTFKQRWMAMAGYVDEAAFDAIAPSLDLRPLAPDITAPYLALAGEDDELSPIEHTVELLRRIPAPRRLGVYRGERHSLGGGPASRNGPNPLDLAADWFVDRFAGRPMEETVLTVEPSGASRIEPLGPWLEAAPRP